jgi:ATP:ADP antiporter, AAA family
VAEGARKVALLSTWFFLTIAALWLLKAVRLASLVARLGSKEIPYVRLASVACVALVVFAYSAALNRLSRVGMLRWVNGLFAVVLFLFWGALQTFGAGLSNQRAFVWTTYIFVEVYAAVAIGFFWTYANDVVTQEEADRLYGMIGLGGVLGGLAGGAFVDVAASHLGPGHFFLISAGLAVACVLLGSHAESVLRPPLRPLEQKPLGAAAAFEGAREVFASRYLLLIVAVVVAYEFTATLTDFSVNVVFEHAYREEAVLQRMYGRLGWIVSTAAIVCQLVLVPLLLPQKRIALLVPPLIMIGAVVGVVALPVMATALVLAAADRGVNYSLQESTMESLYVSLNEDAKFRAKAFIDMFVDRAAKSAAAFVLIIVIFAVGVSSRAALVVAMGSMVVWLLAARRLGEYWPGRARTPIAIRDESSKEP